MKKMSAFYSILMGICMIGMWIMFYTSDSIPEIQTKPIELGMHILAEIITAVVLIIGGFSVLMNKRWGNQIYLLSMGMLLYTLIMSPGYFLQQGDIGFAIMFAVFILLAIMFTILHLTKKEKSEFGLK